MERFQGGPRRMNSVLETPNNLVVVRPCRVKSWRRRSNALRKVGILEVLYALSCERCWRHEGFDGVGRRGRDKGSKRNMVTRVENPCVEWSEPRSTKSRRHSPTKFRCLRPLEEAVAGEGCELLHSLSLSQNIPSYHQRFHPFLASAGSSRGFFI